MVEQSLREAGVVKQYEIRSRRQLRRQELQGLFHSQALQTCCCLGRRVEVGLQPLQSRPRAKRPLTCHHLRHDIASIRYHDLLCVASNTDSHSHLWVSFALARCLQHFCVSPSHSDGRDMITCANIQYIELPMMRDCRAEGGDITQHSTRSTAQHVQHDEGLEWRGEEKESSRWGRRWMGKTRNRFSTKQQRP